jgi:tRNA-specific 2-thiouridylase
MKSSIAIAVSGGIDSLTAAYLLKKQGHDVIGIHFTTGYEKQPHIDQANGSGTASLQPSMPDGMNAHAANTIFQISSRLGIEVKHLDCSTEFKRRIVDYFTHTYTSGQTPNPCMVCNPLIKYGTVLDFALKLGASTLATGHYARISKGKGERFHLLKGVDPKKDQSYFLALMSQKRLARACFPLGEMTKDQVFELADRKGLEPVKKGESQDVCFIREKTYGEFLAKQFGFAENPGDIENVHGKTIGRHKGLHLFTIGQRRGIDCPAAEPYYVVGMDIENNRLIVGFKKDLFTRGCKIRDINWIVQKPEAVVNVTTRVRYRHRAVSCKLTPTGDDTAIVRFDKPQAAISPGQCAVFYNGDEVLGGGWIVPNKG